MARDRLADLKNNNNNGGGWQQNVSSGSQPSFGNSSYSPQGNTMPPQQPQTYYNQQQQQPQYYQQQQQPYYQQQQQQQPQYPPAASSNGRNINYDVLNSPAMDLNTFFQQRDVISQLIDAINSNSEQIRSVNTRALQEVNQGVANQYRQQVEQLTEETKTLIEKARAGSKMLHASRKGDLNTREAQYKAVLRNLNNAVKTFWSVQNDVKTSNKDQIKRQYKIARPQATDYEIEAAIESGRADVFTQEILSSRVADQQRILGAVQDRQAALEKINRTVGELVSLSQELDALINAQQSMIDEVEVHVLNTNTHVNQGVKQLDQANKSALAARKKKWIIFWIVLVIILVLAGVLAYYFTRPKQ
ncbi:Plasma membrane t-SNARE, secretory vesicle fusion [Chytridiales sp. JEL 0842]|nr:Plasma membrane t-SNARE, secretory vesicle fusion [Chytridiales sp. JEL 0842]